MRDITGWLGSDGTVFCALFPSLLRALLLFLRLFGFFLTGLCRYLFATLFFGSTGRRWSKSCVGSIRVCLCRLALLCVCIDLLSGVGGSGIVAGACSTVDAGISIAIFVVGFLLVGWCSRGRRGHCGSIGRSRGGLCLLYLGGKVLLRTASHLRRQKGQKKKIERKK